MSKEGPTLNLVGTFEFDCEDHPDFSSMRAIDCILKQIEAKFEGKSKFKNLYILDARTGSGKSTLFIANLFLRFRKKILVAEPRIVLTRSNAYSIIEHFKDFQIGFNLGFKNSTESVVPSEDHGVTFMTTQLLVNQLQTYYSFFENLSEKLIIIIDEAHLLDIQTLDLLKEVKRFLKKYENEPNCPLFILQSATLRIREFVRYYFPSNYRDFRNDWTSIGHVKGLPNFKVVEHFVNNSNMEGFVELEKENQASTIIASFYLEFFKDKGLFGRQRFTHLIFLPYTKGIEEFGRVLILSLRRDFHTAAYAIRRNEDLKTIDEWRHTNPNSQRILVVPVARNYSKAGDLILNGENNPPDAFKESLIFVATNMIETGKTIKDLTFGLDCGFDTVACFNPLMFDISDFRNIVIQVPESKSKAIQRLGRLGRECPGEFLHFMTQGTYKKLDQFEPPETINSYCISKQLLDISWTNKWRQFDFESSNIYIIKFTIDILINSCSDLIRSGFLTPFSEVCDFGVSEFNEQYRFKYYMKYLHYIKKLPIKDAIVTAAISERSQNVYLFANLEKYQFKNIKEFHESMLTIDVVQSLKKANQTLIKAKYDLTFTDLKILW